jgi:hypothetical protein
VRHDRWLSDRAPIVCSLTLLQKKSATKKSRMPSLAEVLDSKLLLETSQKDTVFDEEIQEDHEEEIESMESAFQVDDLSIEAEHVTLRAEERMTKAAKGTTAILAESLKAASEQVLVEGTRGEYERYVASVSVSLAPRSH